LRGSSELGSSRRLPKEFLLDADVLYSYLSDDVHADHAEPLLLAIQEGRVRGYASSVLLVDLILAYRSIGVSIDALISAMKELELLPLEYIPLTPSIARYALSVYREHGGPRRLHFFDSFHVATAKSMDLPLITTDRYILSYQRKLGITAIDLDEI